jgi:Cu-Zn family superoxide dismutase
MRTRPFLWAFLAIAFVPLNAAADDGDDSRTVRARATIRGCTDPNIRGQAFLSERPSREGVKLVDVTIVMSGMMPGRHAVHIHENGSCTPCAAANGHFDPGPASNSSPEGNHPFHSGDLINLNIGSRGTGTVQTTTSRVTLSPGPLSVFDAGLPPPSTNGPGSSIIIHTLEDLYCPGGPAAGCAGGGRDACGILTLDR